ncbi:MAG TPA: apolipoprotein N-acyltransferase [Verrucomicrobiae bacterium]|nr:apolipoprotein N-acyltransferase [Verrucomicrobiae bacterium]
MKKFSIARWVTGRSLLALLAGLIWAAAFPKIGIAGGAWIAPGFMLALSLGQTPSAAFRLGYVAGVANGLVSLYWLLFVPFPVGAVAGWLALSAYVALFPGLWLWACAQLLPRLATQRGEESGGARLEDWRLWLASARSLAALGWSRRVFWCLTCAAAWVASEIVRGRFLGGFPWNLLGESQYRMLALVQIASITGVYGVSFLAVWTSASLLCSLTALLERTRVTTAARLPGLSGGALGGGTWTADLVVPLMTVGMLMFWGVARIASTPIPKRELNVAMVQPSIPQELIFDPRETTNRFNKLIDLSRLALATKPDLIVWPEAALPGLSEENYGVITNMVATAKVWMIFGADDAEPIEPGSGKNHYFNACFLLDPQGRMVASYRKRHLVIFGEYVPLSKWVPFLRYLTPIEGGFTPGAHPGWFQLNPPKAKIAPLICFEDVFPHLVPSSVTEDTDFLLNLTNNGWFGESAAQWQHATMAVFRAIENGLPLARCTNNGLTCWIDARGGLHEVYYGDSQDIYGSGFKTARVPLLSPGEKRPLTFYTRHGDMFGWACVAVTLATILSQRRKRTATDPNILPAG